MEKPWLAVLKGINHWCRLKNLGFTDFWVRASSVLGMVWVDSWLARKKFVVVDIHYSYFAVDFWRYRRWFESESRS